MSLILSHQLNLSFLLCTLLCLCFTDFDVIISLPVYVYLRSVIILLKNAISSSMMAFSFAVFLLFISRPERHGFVKLFFEQLYFGVPYSSFRIEFHEFSEFRMQTFNMFCHLVRLDCNYMSLLVMLKDLNDNTIC